MEGEPTRRIDGEGESVSQTDVRPWPGDNDHEGHRPPELIDDNAPTPGPLDEIKNGVKAYFDIGVTIGKSVDKLADSQRKLLARLERNTPVDYRRANSTVIPASGIGLIGLGHPDQGTFWEVKQVSVGGTDFNVAAAGTAALYVSAVVPTAGNPVPAGMSAMVDYTTALPDAAQYGSRQVTVNDQERLILVVFGATVGQTYVANFLATVWPVGTMTDVTVN